MMNLKNILLDIDKKGAILVHRWRGREWRLNIIDFLIWIVLPLCVIGIFYKSWQITENRKPDTVIIKTTYSITENCPICGFSHNIEIDKGTYPPKKYKKTCDGCGNEIYLIKPSPKKPKPLPKETNYLQEYYKRLLEKG